MIEFVVDKVPGADHVNDVVQTFVRPAAGAVLFAANSGVVSGMDSTLGLIAAWCWRWGCMAQRPRRGLR